MKYLKTYKLYESIEDEIATDEIAEDIKDILTPLSDTGIEIDVDPKFKRGVPTFIEIFLRQPGGIHSEGPSFKLIPFIDELIHMNSYLNDKGWILKSDPLVSDKNYSFDKSIDNIISSDSLYRVVPIFYVPKPILESNIPSKSFLLDIQDILLEIEDMGLYLKKNVNDGRFFCEIVGSPNGLIDTFEITNELVESLLRINDYAKSNDYKFITFELNMGADKYFQLSSGDLKYYIGEEAWFIDIIISER